MTKLIDMICFIVDGTPRAKQSFRYSKYGSYTDPKVKAWQDCISRKALEAMEGRDPIKGHVAVRLVFVLKSYRRVDCDNLAKCAIDALKNRVFEDDNEVVNLHVVKKVMPKAVSGVFVQIYRGGILP